MHQPMYMLANLALTNKDGAVTAPTSLQIDYVHVYAIPGVSIPGGSAGSTPATQTAGSPATSDPSLSGRAAAMVQAAASLTPLAAHDPTPTLSQTQPHPLIGPLAGHGART
jgi:hypothetical protein